MSASAIFDENFYLTNNADVVVAISQGFFSSALQHFNLFGGKELRAPNATFNPNYYAINNAPAKPYKKSILVSYFSKKLFPYYVPQVIIILICLF